MLLWNVLLEYHMSNLKDFIISLLTDGSSSSGAISSKRTISLAAFIACIVGFFGNLFFGLKMDEFIYNSMMYISIAGMGMTVPEKWAPK